MTRRCSSAARARRRRAQCRRRRPRPGQSRPTRRAANTLTPSAAGGSPASMHAQVAPRLPQCAPRSAPVRGPGRSELDLRAVALGLQLAETGGEHLRGRAGRGGAGRVPLRQRIHQPGPGHLGQEGSTPMLGLGGCLRVADDAERPTPGVRRGRVVEEHEASRCRGRSRRCAAAGRHVGGEGERVRRRASPARGSP